MDPWRGEITNPLSLNRYVYSYNNPVKYVSNKHVADRHIGNKAGWKHKSKWTVTGGDWRTRSRETFRNPDRASKQSDGNVIYEKRYNTAMGVDPHGNKLFYVRVVVDKSGNLVTAFPQAGFK